MAAYEKAINYIIIENDIKSSNGIKDFGEEESCKYASEYFKKVQKYGENNCVFKTPDKVWWNISDLSNPIIILKDELKVKNPNELRALAKDFDNKTVFALIGRFDEVGSLRVDDNGFEQSQENNEDNKKYMTKLWGFINNQNLSESETLTGFAKCNAEEATTCVITVDGEDITYTRIITTSDVNVTYFCKYDRDEQKRTCEYNQGYSSNSIAGEYWISEELKIEQEEAKDIIGSICTKQDCINNGDYYEAAKRKCEKLSGHLASLSELEIARQNGMLFDSKWYVASDEYSSHESYAIKSDGTINSYHKKYFHNHLLCVGNIE